MDKAEATGWGIAAAGHLALLGLLSASFATATRQKPVTPPLEVSFVEEVSIASAAPDPATEAPAQSVAPDFGPSEEAAPAIDPLPAPPEPLPPPPTPVVPPPQPKPQVQPKAAPPPVPRPTPKPAPPKAAPPQPPKAAPPRPQPPKAAPAEKAPARPAPAKTTTRAAAAPAKAAAAAGKGSAQQTRGSRLGRDFLKGLGSDPTPSVAQRPAAAKMDASAKANIATAITRQVQPCANRQVNPGPGAERIQVTINLRLNRDGSLAARPRVVGRTGINDENKRYADRVEDLAVATFVGCSPLRGLPAELYDVSGGWSNFSLRYKLPD